MKNSQIINIYPLFLFILTIAFFSCERDVSEDADLATFPKNGEVFIDAFSSGLEYLPFAGSYLEAFTVDEVTRKSGTASMRFDVPNVGDPNGSFAGAIFPDNGGRNLTEFDALTFWAKATKASTINEIGFGQDFGENKFLVTLFNLELTTNWRQYTIAIPDASKLEMEKGLFWYSEGPEDGEGYTFWIDEVQFVNLGTIAQPRPAIANGQDVDVQTFIGENTQMTGLTQTFNLENGLDQTLTISPAYFDFASSDPNVATVNELGIITAVGTGTAVISASLNGNEAAGSFNLSVTGAFDSAPDPTQMASNVISIFSDVYENEPVDYYNGFWAPFQTTMGGSTNIAGDNVLSYSDLNFVGIQFAVDAPTINAGQMTHFHADVQARENVEPGDFFTIRIVDAGGDNVIGTGDDTSGEVTLDNTSLNNGEWFSLDVPISDFAGLSSRSNLAQVIFVSDATVSEVFVDNVYFYNDGEMMSTGPTVAAPTPTQDASNVISVYSDAYMNVEGTDLNPDWGQATQVSEVSIDGNNTLFYAGLNYQGTQLGSSQDVSGMQFLHFDYWTENSTALNYFLISQGPIEVGWAATVPTNGWVSVDVPLSSFDPVDLADIIQMKVDGNGDVYLDNIYFYGESSQPDTPSQAAPMPMQDAANVISVFSDVYTNIAGSNLNPDWGQATQVSEVSIDGDNTLMYAGLNYQGLELGSSQDLTNMEFLHLDFWTSNSNLFIAFLISTGPAETGIELMISSSGWRSIDIPLSAFNGVDLMDVIQLKFEGNGDIYLDNIYFHGSPSMTDGPTSSAPEPTQDANDVISVFSDSYANIPNTDFNPDWGQATVVNQVDLFGNNTLMYSGLNYQGTQLESNQDVSSMDFLHVDFWTSNSDLLNIFLISPGPAEVGIPLNVPTAGWASVDIPLSEFAGVDLTNLFQFKIDGNGDIYIDNLYFYSDGDRAEPSLPLTFEDGFNPMIAFDFGATSAVVDNPDMNGNSSSKVLEFNKIEGSAWYSGVVYDEVLSTTPLVDLSKGSIIKLKIWSPNAGIAVRLQLEGGTANPVELFNTVNTANEWVELTYDFTGLVNATDTYPKFALFPDFDSTNQDPVSTTSIYYIDDITQE